MYKQPVTKIVTNKKKERKKKIVIGTLVFEKLVKIWKFHCEGGSIINFVVL